MKTIFFFFAVLWPWAAASGQEAPAPVTPAGSGALPSVEQRANMGDPAAMAELGREFLNGSGRVKDPARALEWFLKGARAGNAAAQVGAGYLLNAGLGCPADRTAAAGWFEKAAVQGNAKGQHNLAVLLKQGVRAPAAGMPEALGWFRKAADQGLVEAQAMLGGMHYLSSEGVSQNFAEAAVWLEKAAAGGDNPSRTLFGSMLRFGNSVPEDKPRALALFRAAAEGGHAKAMGQLADMLVKGEGTEKQPVRAAAWYLKALALGEESAKTGWGIMEKSLTPEQLAEARRLSGGDLSGG